MENLMIKIILGHFVGDFFFQTKDMAGNKYLPGHKGFLWCSLHVFLYTSTVAVFTQNFSLIFLLGVFLPHWIVDRYRLAYHWMRFMGRAELLTNPEPNKAQFGPVIYVAMDQTIH